MAKASRLALVAFEDQSLYDRIERVMSDAGERGPRLVDNAFQLLRATPQLVGYAVALASFAPSLLLIVFAAAAPTVTAWMLAGQVYWNVLTEQTRERRLADYYASVLTDRRFAREVRLYSLVSYLLDRWSELYWRTRDEARRRAARLAVRQRAPNLGMTVAVLLGVVWVTSAGVRSASPGTYALLFQSLLGILGVSFGLGDAIKMLGEGSGYASELRSYVGMPTEESADGNMHKALRHFPKPLTVGIRFEDVWFTYPGADAPALEGVSFELAAGESLAIVGENGAGKTTLVKLLLGLYRPDRGRIMFDGVDARELDPCSLRAAASATFQDFVRYELTLAENVGLGQPERIDDPRGIELALARVGVLELARTLPEGVDTLLGPEVGGVDLSGGQWQRVALARCWFREAEMLILDEPTAALDPLTELEVFGQFIELARGRTTVMISHRLGMARLADRVLVLSDGRVVETGTHDELLRLGGEYASLFESQAAWYR